MTTINLKTKFNPDLIVQELEQDTPDLVQQKVYDIINLKEQGVRDALRKLGYREPDSQDNTVNPVVIDHALSTILTESLSRVGVSANKMQIDYALNALVGYLASTHCVVIK
tara:strand:+ start:98863 stop:99195 length:333 start_codon:yes stop_codon:yes gene_type:complete